MGGGTFFSAGITWVISTGSPFLFWPPTLSRKRKKRGTEQKHKPNRKTAPPLSGNSVALPWREGKGGSPRKWTGGAGKQRLCAGHWVRRRLKVTKGWGGLVRPLIVVARCRLPALASWAGHRAFVAPLSPLCCPLGATKGNWVTANLFPGAHFLGGTKALRPPKSKRCPPAGLFGFLPRWERGDDGDGGHLGTPSFSSLTSGCWRATSDPSLWHHRTCT